MSIELWLAFAAGVALGGPATAATTLSLLLVGRIAALAGAVLVAGLCFAPTLIGVMSLVERLVPEQRLTEGMTWLLAGLNVGVASWEIGHVRWPSVG